jgi:hypothetical protein
MFSRSKLNKTHLVSGHKTDERGPMSIAWTLELMIYRHNPVGETMSQDPLVTLIVDEIPEQMTLKSLLSAGSLKTLATKSQETVTKQKFLSWITDKEQE